MATTTEVAEGLDVMTQQQFHVAVNAHGEDAALASLLRSKSNTFRRNEAKRRVPRLVGIIRQREEAEKTAQAAERRADLYKQFRALSPRQRTKRGGFAKFVRSMLGAEWDTCHPILQTDLERYPDCASHSEGFYWRTARVNYREFAVKARAAATALKNRSELYARLAVLAVA